LSIHPYVKTIPVSVKIPLRSPSHPHMHGYTSPPQGARNHTHLHARVLPRHSFPATNPRYSHLMWVHAYITHIPCLCLHHSPSTLHLIPHDHSTARLLYTSSHALKLASPLRSVYRVCTVVPVACCIQEDHPHSSRTLAQLRCGTSEAGPH
jgi:hypothetical protein